MIQSWCLHVVVQSWVERSCWDERSRGYFLKMKLLDASFEHQLDQRNYHLHHLTGCCYYLSYCCFEFPHRWGVVVKAHHSRLRQRWRRRRRRRRGGEKEGIVERRRDQQYFSIKGLHHRGTSHHSLLHRSHLHRHRHLRQFAGVGGREGLPMESDEHHRWTCCCYYCFLLQRACLHADFEEEEGVPKL